MEDLKIGDIITAYHSGIHKLVSIQGTLVKYEQILTGTGTPRKCLHQCHIHGCKKVTLKRLQDERYEEMNQIDKKFDRVKKVLDEQG